jgi:hypothetical protein
MARRDFLANAALVGGAAIVAPWASPVIEKAHAVGPFEESPATSLVTTSRVIGFSVGEGPDTPNTMTQTATNQFFAAMAALGAQVVRLPADTVPASAVTSALNHGLQVNLCFVRETSPTTIKSVVSTWYPYGVVRYEGTNEPNLNGVTPANFRTQNNAMYTAAKSVSPNVMWTSGGLSAYGYYGCNTNLTTGGPWDPVWYLEQALKGGPLNCDRLGFHPYNWYNVNTAAGMLSTTSPYSGWAQMAFLPHNALAAFKSAGYTAPAINATEWGCPTCNVTSEGALNITQQVQAQLITQGIAQWKTYSWAGDLYVYTFWDMPDTPDPVQQNFGVATHNLTTKLAGQAFLAAVGGTTSSSSGGGGGTSSPPGRNPRF